MLGGAGCSALDLGQVGGQIVGEPAVAGDEGRGLRELGESRAGSTGGIGPPGCLAGGAGAAAGGEIGRREALDRKDRDRSSLLQRWPSPAPRCMRPFCVSGRAVAGCCTGSVGEQVAQARVLSQLQQRRHVPRAGPRPLVPPAPHGPGPVSRRRLGSAHGRPDSSWKRTSRCGKSSGKSSVLLLCWMRCLGIEPGPSTGFVNSSPAGASVRRQRADRNEERRLPPPVRSHPSGESRHGTCGTLSPLPLSIPLGSKVGGTTSLLLGETDLHIYRVPVRQTRRLVRPAVFAYDRRFHLFGVCGLVAGISHPHGEAVR